MQRSAYDDFAITYESHWSGFARGVTPVLKKLLLPHIPRTASLLDVCCGTGQLAAQLLEMGYQVTGLDESEAMLRFARRNAPAARFIRADARSFHLRSIFHGAVCTFDSLNHLMSLKDLTAAFGNVSCCLRQGGVFVFDMNMEEAYSSRASDPSNIVEEGHVCAIRPGYDPEERVARLEVTIFRLENGWRRYDLTLLQRCYPERRIRWALQQTGFADIEAYDSSRDLGRQDDTGRLFFVCRKP